MKEYTQPEKLGRHIIEQCLDSHRVPDSLLISIDILSQLNNVGLEIFQYTGEWNAAIEACARYAESRHSAGVNDSLAASLRELKRSIGK